MIGGRRVEGESAVRQPSASPRCAAARPPVRGAPLSCRASRLSPVRAVGRRRTAGLFRSCSAARRPLVRCHCRIASGRAREIPSNRLFFDAISKRHVCIFDCTSEIIKSSTSPSMLTPAVNPLVLDGNLDRTDAAFPLRLFREACR